MRIGGVDGSLQAYMTDVSVPTVCLHWHFAPIDHKLGSTAYNSA